ncbi:hypothetical protein V6N13_023374 [Hibiscus sabdariffa]
MVPNSANDINRIVDGSGIEGAAGVQSPAAGLNSSVSEDDESREADVEGILGRSGVAVDAVVDDGAGDSSGTPEIDDAETDNPPAVFEHDSSSSSTSARSAGANQGKDAVHADSQLDSHDLAERSGMASVHEIQNRFGSNRFDAQFPMILSNSLMSISVQENKKTDSDIQLFVMASISSTEQKSMSISSKLLSTLKALRSINNGTTT